MKPTFEALARALYDNLNHYDPSEPEVPDETTLEIYAFAIERTFNFHPELIVDAMSMMPVSSPAPVESVVPEGHGDGWV